MIEPFPTVSEEVENPIWECYNKEWGLSAPRRIIRSVSCEGRLGALKGSHE